ncbi:D-alanyl-D-alanine carboxypeptidase family protein [Actinomadura sp. HBU206391]|uniref:D-alanyl-D-alanine carboxypeptidase family protein n=1 Tax=Actinomadura sp. HBU206391 TaxID=2731692 RepID=UPI00164F1E4D|nr:D-alanyl-D-alanine carboxypeptidase [Actinomadura sp. HBU206391]MBC6456871.1 D-alanyl-D-alanine carboxypeptidase [Actinomadura sp. HBU206391]
MGTVRRATALITAPLVVALTTAGPVIEPAAGAARTGEVAGAVAGEPIGGSRLGGRGVVYGRAQGVKPPPKIEASSYLIADGDTGEVLAAKDPHGRYLPASTLKTLTSVALIPKLDRNALIRPAQSAVDVEGTKVGMTTKWRYPVSDLFKALMMVSGNDAALVLTQAGGGMRRTLATMNAEAKRLQANDTLAGSPNGLDVDLGLSVKTQHTSAYDLTLILRQGLRLRDFREYVGTIDAKWPGPPSKKQRARGQRVGGYPIYTHNQLLRPGRAHYRGMIGGKNGYTNAAQQTFVGAARRNGHTIIVALMHSPVLWSYATELLDWGFAARGRVQPVGTLVNPLDTEKKPEPKRDNGTLPGIPLDRDKASGWGLTALAAGGGTVIVIGAALVLVLMRRRRAGTAGGAPPPRPEDAHEPADPPAR